MRATAQKNDVILVRPRIYLGKGLAIGPGKIDLLRTVAELKSIAAAARKLKIPYKRAWVLIDSLNQGFGKPVVETTSGGKGGGGTSLTILGQQLVEKYDALEKQLNAQAAEELAAVRALTE
jgi:molybdate transport system regulatory protein